MFADDLKRHGWTEIVDLWKYAKGDWKVHFDTSSWLIVETKSNPRVFDVHVPGDYESSWTVNLIEHLCQMEDERHRFREVLEKIRDDKTANPTTRSRAEEALEQCYHTWLVNLKVAEGQPGRVYCQICKQIKNQ